MADKNNNKSSFMKRKSTDKTTKLDKMKSKLYVEETKIEKPKEPKKEIMQENKIPKTLDPITQLMFKVSSMTSVCVKSLVFMKLSDDFKFTNEQLKEINDFIDTESKGIIEGETSFPEIIDVSREEFEMKFPKEILDLIYSNK